jgi:hypothetical protein
MCLGALLGLAQGMSRGLRLKELITKHVIIRTYHTTSKSKGVSCSALSQTSDLKKGGG